MGIRRFFPEACFFPLHSSLSPRRPARGGGRRRPSCPVRKGYLCRKSPDAANIISLLKKEETDGKRIWKKNRERN
jgi:hypothetical protein